MYGAEKIAKNANRIANQQLPVFNKMEGFSLIVPDYEDLPNGACKLSPTSSNPIALQRKDKNIPKCKEKMYWALLKVNKEEFHLQDDEKSQVISASADGGPRSRVRARRTLRSAPHRH